MSKHTPEKPGLPTNKDRAVWAGKGLTEFCRQVYSKTSSEEPETLLSDFLADVMHWADEHKVDFEVALERARYNYEEEKLEENDP